MTPLVLVGAGGFARETAEAVAALNADGRQFEVLGFLDDDPALAGQEVDGLPVLGPISDPVPAADRFAGAQFVVCVGSPRRYSVRQAVVSALALPDRRYATIVHPTASLARSTVVGPGTVLLALTVTTASVRIGRHVAVMPHTVLTHDDVVEDFATLGAGVRLAGGVRVGRGAYIGAGALVREECAIGAWSLVGMGAVVTVDVPAGQVWTGVPARFRRTASPGGRPDVTSPGGRLVP